MEDSFKVRIDRTFGSLASSSQVLSSSLWSLTDEEIERKEWKRDPVDAVEDEPVGPPPPFPSNLDGFFLENGASDVADENPGSSVKTEDNQQQLEDDLESLDEGDDEEDDIDADDEEQQMFENGGESTSGSLISKDYEGSNDELEIKNSIGMDCTLDYEEEEDEYDKVAVGQVKSTDRIYLGNFGDYGVQHVITSELPENFGDVSKDPRANHSAAQLRIREDEEAAKNLSSLQVSVETTAFKTAIDKNNQSEEGSQSLKPILKRKESEKDSSTEKRVRFASGCKESDEKGFGELTTVPNVGNGLSTVPDYLRNPKAYRHYTIDYSNDMDDQSNRQACMDFRNALRKSKQTEADEPPADLSMPVKFNPKRKSGDGFVAKTSGDSSDMENRLAGERLGSKPSLPPPGIVAENAQVEDDVCVMDEDDSPQEMETRRTNRATRKYRSKANLDVDETSS